MRASPLPLGALLRLTGAAVLFGNLLGAPAPGAAAGDPERGAEVFRPCGACHALTPGEHRTGPSLAGIFGREAGTIPGFTRYSPALEEAEVCRCIGWCQAVSLCMASTQGAHARSFERHPLHAPDQESYFRAPLVLFDLASDGSVLMIYPLADEPPPRLSAGETFELQLRSGPPFGADHLVAALLPAEQVQPVVALLHEVHGRPLSLERANRLDELLTQATALPVAVYTALTVLTAQAYFRIVHFAYP